MKKVSVIIPVYNVEKYVRKCLNSIIFQTYKNLEIIIINDGSTDQSKEICEEYEIQDQRVQLINQKNQGLSAARNSGIEVMTGEYVTFVDSDDFISLNFIEQLVAVLEECDSDISMGNFVVFYEDTPEEKLKNLPTTYSKIQNYNKSDSMKKLIEDDSEIYHATWGKLYKSKLWDNVRFPIKELFEDYATTYKVFDQIDKLTWVNSNLYFYFQRNDSITGSPYSRNKAIVLKQMEEYESFIREKYPELLHYFLLDKMIRSYRDWWVIYLHPEWKDLREKYWENITFNRSTLLESNDLNIAPNYRLVLKSSIFGEYITYKAIKLAKKFKKEKGSKT